MREERLLFRMRMADSTLFVWVLVSGEFVESTSEISSSDVSKSNSRSSIWRDVFGSERNST